MSCQQWSIVTFYLGCMVSEKTRFNCQSDMTSSSVLCQGCCTHFFMTNPVKGTTSSRLRSIVTFYLECMVSEKTRFYYKPDMMSSWFRRQRALQAIFHGGFWKSEQDILIAVHSNFHLWCRVSEIKSKPDMTTSWFRRQGYGRFYMTDSGRCTMTSW